MKHSHSNMKPMSFSMMRKKIESQEYLSSKLFVQDFQQICCDAMDYHQRDSVFWKAAKSMLDQGTAYLEKNTEKAKEILEFLIKTNKQHETQGSEASDNRNTSMGDAVGMEMEHSKSKHDREVASSGLRMKNSTQLQIRKDDQQLESDVTFIPPSDEDSFGNPFSNLCTTSEGTIHELEKNCFCTDSGLDVLTLSGSCKEVDDTLVDITESECIGDDLRFDSPKQGTESSSSFGGTDDDSETCNSVESESDLWEGNSAFVQENCGGVPVKRKKSNFSDQWKAHRRDTEWRCQWLELRIKDLQSRAYKYDHILKEIQAKKLGVNQKHFNIASAARAAPLIGHSRQRILHRKPKKVRSERELSTYMSQHPLFSLYENITELDELLVDDDPNCVTDRDETEIQMAGVTYFNNHHLGKPGTVDDQNTVERILYNIENLQSRIIRMRNRLDIFSLSKSGKIVIKNILQNSLSIQSPKEAVQDPVCTLSGNSMAMHIQPARPDFIKTPCWRIADDSIKMVHTGAEDTSEEGTDDEIYTERHRDLELKEKLLHKKANPRKKLSASCRFHKGDLGPIIIKEKSDNEIYLSPQGGELYSSGYFSSLVPKGRRSGRSRPVSTQEVKFL